MSILLLQLFVLLLLAAVVGWLVGAWRQRAAARQRETALVARLKTSESRLHQLSITGGAINESNTSENNTSENNVIAIPLGTRGLQAAMAAEQVSELRTELSKQKRDAERWEASYRGIEAQQTELTTAKLALDAQIERYQEQDIAELGVAGERLQDAQAELAQREEALAEAKAEAQQWHSAYLEMEGLREELIKSSAIHGQSEQDRKANEEKLESLLADLQQAEVTASESERRMEELARTQALAERNVGRMRNLYLKLRKQFDSVSQHNREAEAERLTTEQRVEQLTEEVVRRKEIASTLHSEFLKRRSFVAQLRADLERAQASLVESQRQANEMDNQRMQVDAVNESLRGALAAQQQENRSTPLADMQAPVEPPLQEPSNSKPASKSDDRRVKALETIVRNQRAKLDLLSDVVGDMQVLLGSEQSPSVRVRRQLQPRRTGISNQSDNLQLINGIGWRKATRLRNLGFHSFGDIARLTEKDVLWLDQVLRLEGSILRQDWVGQSRVLSIDGARRDKLARQTKGMRDPKVAPG